MFSNMDQYLHYQDVFGDDEDKPKAKKGHPYGRKGKPAPKIGATCPVCREKRSLTGDCYCTF
ncbi:hypothetical protein SEA_WEASELS2_39 [Rhodococcus phage Weasels2]|uniref:Uncharacterized protein n=1 Tax=Rhodococcus phage Weasels2 TaxID=1897437 RepID=A0A1I9SA23_9CAUD|nr:hypothetical protein FDH04_gp039 [Rhodococcus phage Weasels2]AOZ63629.1 hypothetical protein SEA_WEASELS2_39 [Rhodococcus phage Weasels2]